MKSWIYHVVIALGLGVGAGAQCVSEHGVIATACYTIAFTTAISYVFGLIQTPPHQ